MLQPESLDPAAAEGSNPAAMDHRPGDARVTATQATGALLATTRTSPPCPAPPAARGLWRRGAPPAQGCHQAGLCKPAQGSTCALQAPARRACPPADRQPATHALAGSAGRPAGSGAEPYSDSIAPRTAPQSPPRLGPAPAAGPACSRAAGRRPTARTGARVHA